MDKKKINIILGSSSLNRKKILESIFDDITVIKPEIDEKKIRSQNPYELPKMITKQKTLEVTRKLVNEDLCNDVHILITSDQIAIFNNQVREKPINKDQAFNFLKSYSNNEVTTVSSIFVTNLNTGKQIDKTIVGKVKWKKISDEIISKVIDKGVIYGACGGFSIEDEDLKSSILSIEGGEDNVKGLSLKDCLNMIFEVILN
tara:strand:- start:2331 stop:2936 length:606 start_codon:yes stop_codon:yes gene_type:complete